MHKHPAAEDLRVFTAVVRKSSFGGAATELGTSPAYVSKRIRLLEQDLQVKLLHRTTRRVAVTEEGERVFHWAQSILDDMDQLLQEVAFTRREPRGQLGVCSSFGFGRQIVAAALSRLVEQHAGADQQRMTGRRQLDAFGGAHDERAAEHLLQIGNALTDGGGDGVRAVGRPRDASGIGDGDKQLEVAQVELHGA